MNALWVLPKTQMEELGGIEELVRMVGMEELVVVEEKVEIPD